MRLPTSERSLYGCACRYGRPHKGETTHHGAMSHGCSRPGLL